ncbi:ATP-binding protein [Pantanalinema rosaneae CENA516]|uniref:ATP-binding protein n=1 Tax=Pantanalinema rosaneae TaxID=1620701 RepID=UPI003D6FF9E6
MGQHSNLPPEQDYPDVHLIQGSAWMTTFPPETRSTSRAVQMRQLEIQLRHEQCLTQLGRSLQRCVTAYLELDDGTIEAAAQAETDFWQTVVQEVGATLEDTLVAIVRPTFLSNHDAGAAMDASRLAADIVFDRLEDEQPHWTIGYLAAPVGGQTWAVPWLLAAGSPLQLQIGNTIATDDLEFWQSQYPEHIRSIVSKQQRIGWLFLLPSYPMEAAIGESVADGERVNFIEQVGRQCAASWHQLQLLQAQKQAHQQVLAHNQELVQTNQLKSEFLANTSHEIRTPLSSILGFTHLLQQQGFNAMNLRHQEYLKIILTSGQHLLALINDILDLSKIEANQLSLQWEAVDVREVCQMSLTLVKEKASDKGLELRLEIDPSVTTILVDPLRLKQMLFNLLSNAIKFTLQGQVGLQVAPANHFLCLTVWDTGTGISAEQQQLLFKPYSQLDNAAVTRGEGTGLGLALTQKLAELHGGSIQLTSELNRGSQFRIFLPLKPAGVLQPESVDALDCSSANTVSVAIEPSDRSPLSAPDQLDSSADRFPKARKAVRGSQPAESTTTTHQSGQNEAIPKTILTRPNSVLLVEDNPHNARLVLTYLSKLGYEVTWAKLGQEMWQALDRALPALILMDIHLPDEDGLALTQQLRTDDRYHHIPVIAQTAMAMKGDRDLCLEAGVNDYISKPIDLDILATLVAKYARSVKASPENRKG